VDSQENVIKLDASMTKDSEIRSIPMTGILQDVLKGIERSPHIPWVFHDGDGRPFKDVKTSFIHALERAKITDFTFHDLRHTFASHFMMANHDMKALMEILGHASLRMTQRYAHIGDDHKRDEMMNFGERISGTMKPERNISKAGF
jgi:integrase